MRVSAAQSLVFCVVFAHFLLAIVLSALLFVTIHNHVGAFIFFLQINMKP